MDLKRTCTFILASSSPRRSHLLEAYGYTFSVMPSRAEERTANSENVRDRVLENARLKGTEVMARLGALPPDPGRCHIVLAADTLVAMDHKVFGKPRDLDQAHRFLEELGGKTHVVLTGVFLHLLEASISHAFVEETRVTLRVLPREERCRLFQRVSPLDKAAAYGYQDAPDIVSDLQGSRTNVFGLPMKRLAAELETLVRAVHG